MEIAVRTALDQIYVRKGARDQPVHQGGPARSVRGILVLSSHFSQLNERFGVGRARLHSPLISLARRLSLSHAFENNTFELERGCILRVRGNRKSVASGKSVQLG